MYKTTPPLKAHQYRERVRKENINAEGKTQELKIENDLDQPFSDSFGNCLSLRMYM